MHAWPSLGAPLTLPAPARLAVCSPQREAARAWAWKVLLPRERSQGKLGAQQQYRSLGKSAQDCRGYELQLHRVPLKEEEPNIFMWKSQILNYAAEPGVQADANCQRGKGNRTENFFKFGSERKKNLHRARGWGEDDKRGWCNPFPLLHKLQMSNYG